MPTSPNSLISAQTTIDRISKLCKTLSPSSHFLSFYKRQVQGGQVTYLMENLRVRSKSGMQCLFWMKRWSQSEKCPVVDVTGERSKVQCCKSSITKKLVKSMNQGKLEVVEQEMARANIDILGISELKWTGKCEFNSDDYYTYYCGQESLRRNGVALIVNKRVRNTVLGYNLKKWQNDLCSVPRQIIQYHSNPSLCPNQ